jgi:hypothetical protein
MMNRTNKNGKTETLPTITHIQFATTSYYKSKNRRHEKEKEKEWFSSKYLTRTSEPQKIFLKIQI